MIRFESSYRPPMFMPILLAALVASGGIGRASTAVDPAVVDPGVTAAPGTLVGERVQKVEKPGVGLIPIYRYRAHFGQEHKFHLSRAAYGQDRHFQYGGYSFGFVDEWPTNWLPAEDVFVTQIDGGYFLCNRRYPGVNIPLSIAAPANRNSANRNTSMSRDASIHPARSRAPKASRAKTVTSPSASAG